MTILLGIPLAFLIVGMCVLFGWLVPADKAKQLREDIEDTRSAMSLGAVQHWTRLRTTSDYWAARFTYQETGELTDLEKMCAKVTAAYPDLETLEHAPDDPPALPEPHPLEHVPVSELRNMPLAEYARLGGAGGSGTTTIACGGDQRGFANLRMCSDCQRVPLYSAGAADVTCVRCLGKRGAEYARKEPGKCPKCAEELPYTRGTTDVLCGGCWADSQVFSHHGTPPVQGVISRHDELAQEQTELGSLISVYQRAAERMAGRAGVAEYDEIARASDELGAAISAGVNTWMEERDML